MSHNVFDQKVASLIADMRVGVAITAAMSNNPDILRSEITQRQEAWEATNGQELVGVRAALITAHGRLYNLQAPGFEVQDTLTTPGSVFIGEISRISVANSGVVDLVDGQHFDPEKRTGLQGFRAARIQGVMSFEGALRSSQDVEDAQNYSAAVNFLPADGFIPLDTSFIAAH